LILKPLVGAIAFLSLRKSSYGFLNAEIPSERKPSVRDLLILFADCVVMHPLYGESDGRV